MWGFNLGGVGKCFLAYAGLGKIDSRLTVHTACINLKNESIELAPLREIGATIIDIKGRLDFSWLPRCKQLIDEVKPDLIFTHGFNGPIVVQMLRIRYGLRVPLLCSYHSEYHPPSFNRRFVAPLFNRTVHELYKHAALSIVTVAQVNRVFLVRRGVDGAKISVIYNGIASRPLAHRKLSDLLPNVKLDDNAITVGIASRLDPIKGLAYLLEAVAMVRRKGIPINLILLGDGPLRASLQAEAEALGISEYVHFIGFQNNIPEWLDTLDIFALPSLSEAHSISLLEAMRAGKAIVATNVGGNPESVRDGNEAILVPPADSQALAGALTRLVGDVDLRHRLGVAARKRFETEFTEDIMKRRLADWLLSFAPQVQSR